MMAISTKTRYGLQALVEIARRRQEGPVRLQTVARAQRLSPKYLHTLLKTLCDVGILGSVRGARGGYELRRAPEAVTLRELIAVLEGRRSFRPPRTAGARLVNEWLTGAEREVDALLDRHTLADLVARAEAAPATMYFI